MKKGIMTMMFVFALTTVFTGCREEKSPEEKVEAALENVSEELEDAADDVKDAAEDLEDEIEEQAEETGDDNN